MNWVESDLNAYDMLCYLRTEILNIYTAGKNGQEKAVFEAHLRDVIETGRKPRTGWTENFFQQAVAFKYEHIKTTTTEKEICVQ